MWHPCKETHMPRTHKMPGKKQLLETRLWIVIIEYIYILSLAGSVHLRICQLLGRPVVLTLVAHWNHLRSFKDCLRLTQASKVWKLVLSESVAQLWLWTPALDCAFLEGARFLSLYPLECHARKQLLIEIGDTVLKVPTGSSYGRVESTWALTPKKSVFASQFCLFRGCVTLDTTGCLRHL